MLTYFKEVDLDEGFAVLGLPKSQRLIAGRTFDPAAGKELYLALLFDDQPLRCWQCGLLANCFILNRGKNDHVRRPVLDLYSKNNGVYTLMTRDHIIPKSRGGTNDVANLRVGCGPCNHSRGNYMTEEEVAFRDANPHLWKPEHDKGETVLAPKMTPAQKRRRCRRRKSKTVFPSRVTTCALALA
jgi:hypothetical protein